MEIDEARDLAMAHAGVEPGRASVAGGVASRDGGGAVVHFGGGLDACGQFCAGFGNRRCGA